MTSPTMTHFSAEATLPCVSNGKQMLSASADKPSQKTELIELLQRGWVTTLDALNAVGCMALSQRAGEFKRAGLNVQDRWVELGNGKRVKAWRIAA